MSMRLQCFDSSPCIITTAASLRSIAGFLLAALLTLPVAARPLLGAFALFPISTLTQESANSENDQEVPSELVEKYIAVYRAMQLDRSLTVERAASQQGMTLEAFRQLENRVQRDDTAMEHVRDTLKESAGRPTSSATPTGSEN
jgi:hypothetical protein